MLKKRSSKFGRTRDSVETLDLRPKLPIYLFIHLFIYLFIYLFIFNYYSTVTSQPKIYVIKVKKTFKRLIFRWPCIENYVTN